MVFESRDFGSSEAVLREIQEKSDDIERAVIPMAHQLTARAEGGPSGPVENIGMILHYVNGTKCMIHKSDAQMVLNDGILNRMKIKIELWSPLDSGKSQ